MNDLERRALLGDKQAQRECTEKGIVLPCPWCGKSDIALTDMADAVCRDDKDEDFGMFSQYPVYCCDMSKGGCGNYMCSCSTNKFYALLGWNTRPAPPIGRCKDCKYYPYARVETGGFVYCPQSEMQIEDENAFCSSFEPKEG